MFMFICGLLKLKKKKSIRNSSLANSSSILQGTRVGKLEYHRRKEKKSITLEFSIYKELEFGKLEYCVAWNSSLPNSSSMWHFFNQKIHVNTSLFMKLEYLKLDLHSKLEFQKSSILLLIL